ncbi:MAG: hypothetical protein RIK87_28670 [Fuerstiella sp.]
MTIRIRRQWFWLSWIVVVLLCTRLEWRRLAAVWDQPSGLQSWLVYWDMETTLPLLVLLTLPILVRLCRVRRHKQAHRREPRPLSWPATLAGGLLVFSVSLGCSWRVGAEPISFRSGYTSFRTAFADLPPAYHDEYSYMLQARTFRDGRLSYPGMSVRPDLFHQFHVLNERRTVSRYFPWTGLWIASFQLVGSAVKGHWLAGALAAVFFYLTLLQISRLRTALTGGMLIAVSPGLAIFSNLLLAHHPTMLALSVFCCAFVRMMVTGRLRWSLVAGFGLTLAMLGRPMTAAGFALPFGLWLAARLWQRRGSPWLAAGFAVPILCGLTFLAVLNHDATGHWTRTAYQEYTDRYTPRHRFGFANGAETTTSVRPEAIKAYDNWAADLTPSLAARNVRQRWMASFQWSLGIFPLLFGLILSLPVLLFSRCDQADRDCRRKGPQHAQDVLRLLALSILSLHIVHIPYWYDGIMHWHYVFETAPLLLLLAGVGFVHGAELLSGRCPPRLAGGWMLCVVLSGLLPAWFTLPVYDDPCKVSAAISEQSFSRTRFEFFHRTVTASGIQKPALILVNEQGTDPQLSYIINPPDLQAEVLVCRRPTTAQEIQELRTAFAPRRLYAFDPGTMTFTEMSESDAEFDPDSESGPQSGPGAQVE